MLALAPMYARAIFALAKVRKGYLVVVATCLALGLLSAGFSAFTVLIIFAASIASAAMEAVAVATALHAKGSSSPMLRRLAGDFLWIGGVAAPIVATCTAGIFAASGRPFGNPSAVALAAVATFVTITLLVGALWCLPQLKNLR